MITGKFANGKAHIEVKPCGVVLTSYSTPVAIYQMNNSILVSKLTGQADSKTTKRHINLFIDMFIDMFTKDITVKMVDMDVIKDLSLA